MAILRKAGALIGVVISTTMLVLSIVIAFGKYFPVDLAPYESLAFGGFIVSFVLLLGFSLVLLKKD